MIFAMVIIGGITRLTESGLSIVDWRPLLGWIPPLSETDWQALFRQYQDSPQYREVNVGMSLDEFKTIYWWEFIHRLWGRLIGLVFLGPFVWFFLIGKIDRKMAPWLIGLFVLGGLQGALGWYMVKSGLVDVPAVSQYRLAAHLVLAVVIYAFAFWLALRLLAPERTPAWTRKSLIGAALSLWLLLVIGSGAFVAGLDAGLSYNTFPLMDGRLVPELYFALSPPIVNVFDNPAAVQFNHRLLASVTVILVVFMWITVNRSRPEPRTRLLSNLLILTVVVQFGLGVATLVLFVPVWLGALHQAGALALFTIAVYLTFELSRCDAQISEATNLAGIRP